MVSLIYSSKIFPLILWLQHQVLWCDSGTGGFRCDERSGQGWDGNLTRRRPRVKPRCGWWAVMGSSGLADWERCGWLRERKLLHRIGSTRKCFLWSDNQTALRDVGWEGEKKQEEKSASRRRQSELKDENLRMRFGLFKLWISWLCQKMSGRRWQPGLGKVGRSKI